MIFETKAVGVRAFYLLLALAEFLFNFSLFVAW
jgi:hypothetical protein